MKSLYIKLTETLDQMNSKQRDKFFEARAKGSPIEVQVNAAEAILSGRVKESTPITKHNGASQNFVEGSPFNEGRNVNNQPKRYKDPYAKGDQLLLESLRKTGDITEAEFQKLTGKPAEYDNLTEVQKKSFDFAKSIGIKERDALNLAMVGCFKEVSR
jgi:hypothetical protein